MSLLFALLFAATPSAEGSDPRLLPFLGCWTAQADVGESTTTLCLRAAGDALTITTLLEGVETGVQTLRIGSSVAVAEGGCSGREGARWSADGRRLLLESVQECAGGLRRASGGFLALVSGSAMVDVQAVRVAEEVVVRTVRYVSVPEQRADALAVETARLHASQPLALDAVVEGVRGPGPEATEALLVARRAGYSLDAGTLVQLADAGVPPSTLDVLVALSYPQHFRVEEPAPVREVVATRSERWNDGYARSRYACSGYRPYSYSAYGCDPYGWRSGYDYVRIVPVRRGQEDDGNGGTLVPGRGYRQGEGESRGTARPRSGPERSQPARATSGGGSSGKGDSDSRDTGRRAKPRDQGSQ